MSNYTDNNLISIPSSNVPAGTLAMKVGDNVFTAGSVIIGATDYYKCATVDTTNQTWTGYKAYLSSGKYSYESAVTSNLTYGVGFTPEPGKVYTNGALASVVLTENPPEGMPTIGLVFYASLSSNSATAETGQTLTTSGTVTFQTYNGIPCGYFNGGAQIYRDQLDLDIPVGESERTVSVWIYSNADRYTFAVNWGNYVGSSDGAEAIGIGYLHPVYGEQPDIEASSVSPTGSWIHLCGVVSQKIRKLYVNGVIQATAGGSLSQPTNNQTGVQIGSGNGNFYFSGYIAAVRIYNRALSDQEIATLAAEFTPTQS